MVVKSELVSSIMERAMIYAEEELKLIKPQSGDNIKRFFISKNDKNQLFLIKTMTGKQYIQIFSEMINIFSKQSVLLESDNDPKLQPEDIISWFVSLNEDDLSKIIEISENIGVRLSELASLIIRQTYPSILNPEPFMNINEKG